MSVTRRRWLQMAGTAAGGALLQGCSLEQLGPGGANPRLTARPRTGVTPPPDSGKFAINAGGTDAIMYVPQSAVSATSIPLLVFLHGAGRTVEPFIDAFAPSAEANGVVVVAPFAQAGTWDAIRAAFGPDAPRINSTLEYVFHRWSVDPHRIALAGFSDGATYTLAVGRANGDLFSRLVAFAPGFLISVEPVGLPPILVTHGTSDPVLSFANTAQSIVPALVQLGHEVDFRTFDGGHVVPLSAANEVMADLGNH